MVISLVKEKMESKGVTLREIMEKTGLANETVLRARGEKISQCRLETLAIIADYLGCKIKDLFEEVES